MKVTDITAIPTMIDELGRHCAPETPCGNSSLTLPLNQWLFQVADGVPAIAPQTNGEERPAPAPVATAAPGAATAPSPPTAPPGATAATPPAATPAVATSGAARRSETG